VSAQAAEIVNIDHRQPVEETGGDHSR